MKNDKNIIELKNEHYNQVKDLLVDLQKFVIEIDKYNLNLISQDYREKYFEFLLQDCSKNQGKIFVYVSQNKILGMIAGFVEAYDDRDKLVYACPKKGVIAELIVDKTAREGGIGTLLLNKMEDYFKSISCQYIQIDVFAYNEKAIKFYSKNGYEDRMLTMFKKL